MLMIMFIQIVFTFIGRSFPDVLGLNSTITADEIVLIINKKRLENGLPELTVNQSLSLAAQQKAADMIAKNYWAHTSPDGITPWHFFKNVNYHYLYAGENLARDFIDSDSVVKAWLNSPTHRDNLLSGRYRETGVAVVNDVFQGQPTTLVVQLFGTQASSTVPEVIGKITPTAQAAEIILAEIKPGPIINSFQLTKSISISLTVLLLSIILIDMAIITKKKIIRLSGKGLAHLIFLSILLIILIGIQPGIVL